MIASNLVKMLIHFVRRHAYRIRQLHVRSIPGILGAHVDQRQALMGVEPTLQILLSDSLHDTPSAAVSGQPPTWS